MGLKCDFSDAELNERLIELIIASTQIIDFQKELLQKEKGFALHDAIKLGRSYEAATNNVKLIKDHRWAPLLKIPAPLPLPLYD